MTNLGTIKRRKPWLAVFLSLGTTGLGQFYNGQWRKGLVFFGLEAAIGCLIIASLGSFAGLCASVALVLVVNLFIAGDAYLTAKRSGDYVLGPTNRWWVYALLIIGNLALGGTLDMAAQSRFYQSFRIPSGSMLQTLRIGNHFMAEILSAKDTLRRGDVVVFLQKETDRFMVKRVIALPGEIIEQRAKTVFINGSKLEEPYARHLSDVTIPIRDTYRPSTLGPDEYFLMGDNREKSYDSRWLGPIRRDTIKARALYLYFPGEPGSTEWFERLGMAVR